MPLGVGYLWYVTILPLPFLLHLKRMMLKGGPLSRTDPAQDATPRSRYHPQSISNAGMAERSTNHEIKERKDFLTHPKSGGRYAVRRTIRFNRAEHAVKLPKDDE
jgi:hypothetical protein